VPLRIGQTASVAVYGRTPGIDSHVEPLSATKQTRKTFRVATP
jgi:hypothetical protein